MSQSEIDDSEAIRNQSDDDARSAKIRLMCLIVLSCAENSERSRKELERVIVNFHGTSWSIERITLLEDRRSV